ncbi:MAG TPA: tetratricopeptide repeat protein [Candidatus Binataceae bacterium]|nr:tetratricopeptide repeat protein [Candidatus Binataceae bacterium]
MQKQDSSKRLDSWKAIAAYLGRDVRTVQRWEKTLSLPIHRKRLEKLDSVYAFTDELDRWWGEGRSPELKPDSQPSLVPQPARRRRLIAVLPLRNHSGLADQEYFSEGLTEELIGQLSQINPEELGVIGFRSVQPYKNTSKPLNQIGRELGTSYLLDGNVRRADNRIRIDISLIDADDQHVIAREKFDRDLSDILELQSEVAQTVSRRIAVTITAKERTGQRGIPPEAYDSYLRGRELWNRRREEDLRMAIRLFQRAIDQDLNYAPAYAGIADCYALLSNIMTGAMPPSEAMPKAKSAARKALELNPDLADAHASIAYVNAFFDWNWQPAEKAFDRALELNPSYAPARQWYSELLIIQGRMDDAIAEIKRAGENDPLSMAITASYVSAMYHGRQYDDVIAECRTMLALDPRNLLAYMNLGRAWMMKQEYPKAIAELQAAVELTGYSSAMLLALLGHAFGLARKMRDARDVIKQLSAIARLKYVPAFDFAIVYAAIGDKDNCFKALRKARAERCEYLLYLGQEPAADPIRNDQRFAKVVPLSSSL